MNFKDDQGNDDNEPRITGPNADDPGTREGAINEEMDDRNSDVPYLK